MFFKKSKRSPKAPGGEPINQVAKKSLPEGVLSSGDNGKRFPIGTIEPWIRRRLSLKDDYEFIFIHRDTGKDVKSTKQVTYWSPKIEDLKTVSQFRQRFETLYSDDALSIRLINPVKEEVAGGIHLSSIRKPH